MARWATVTMAVTMAVAGWCPAGEDAGAQPAVTATPEATPPSQPPPQQVAVNPAELFAMVAGEAEKGNPQAMLNLGTLYENGVGVRRNFTKALEWYSRAAAADLAEAHLRVGVCYEVGFGTTVDAEKAFLHFEKAAQYKDPNGLYKLAEFYIQGVGVKQNQPWGVSLLERALAAGHAAAANDLGMIHHQGLYGTPQDDAKALGMFTAAAELGNAEAMKNLGVMYRGGVGTTADPVEAMKWYMLAFDSGFNQQELMPVLHQLGGEIGEEKVEEARTRARTWVEAQQAKRAAEADTAGATQPAE